MVRLLLLTFILFHTSSAFSAPNILVFGDSISAEFGLQRNQGWVALLQSRLSMRGYAYNVINASISGETSGGGLRRISKTLDRHAPDIIIIELGANDGLRGLNLPKLQTNLSRMVDLSLKAQAAVVILGMQLPPNYGSTYTQAFSTVFLNISTKKKVSLVPFLLQGFEDNLNYFQPDQVHPNARAQNLILDNIWPVLLPLLSPQQ